MDAQSYNAALADLRGVRDQIKKMRAALLKLEADRDKRIAQLASYEKAKAERIAPAAGLSVADIVALAPGLAPDSLAVQQAPRSPAPEPSPAKAPSAATVSPPTQAQAAPGPTTTPRFRRHRCPRGGAHRALGAARSTLEGAAGAPVDPGRFPR
ncbi:hypothetical protein LUX03_00330 [Streptomyces sudanensis]|nr:hypothetical protein [Streptomyces sudanensis]MCP9956124.1 hypothetical protein [Streptomyces sudanensis]